MAGHSKWANIKRQKARVDAKKGKTFTQLSRAIIVAARHGIPDPAVNFQLRTAIEKAKAAGIPNDNIRTLAKVFHGIVKDLLFYLIKHEILASSSTSLQRI